MRFSMLYSGEQILSFKSCLVFNAGDSLIKAPTFQKNNYLSWLASDALTLVGQTGGNVYIESSR